jgi:hypothetical protein
MLLASISDVGENDAVIEAIRGVSDEDGATNYRAVKNRLLELFSEKHPEKGSIFGGTRIHNGHHRQGKSVRVTLARDDKGASRATIVAKTAIMQVTAGQSRIPNANQTLPKGSPRGAKAVHPSHQKTAS